MTTGTNQSPTIHPASDHIDILLAHDRWASGRLLDACESLSPEQLSQKFEIGPGSLHDTVIHIIGAMRAWTDTLATRPPRPWIDEAPRRTVAELRTLLADAAEDLARSARLGPMDQILSRERQGQVSQFTRAIIISHVATHGVHHRAQCLNMLRRLGVKPLPQSSVTEWSRAGRPAR